MMNFKNFTPKSPNNMKFSNNYTQPSHAVTQPGYEPEESGYLLFRHLSPFFHRVLCLVMTQYQYMFLNVLRNLELQILISKY